MRTAAGILLALAVTVALVASSMLALELMRPGIGVLAPQNLPWRIYPSLSEGGAGLTSMWLFSIQLYAWIAALALAAGLLTFRLRVVRSNRAAIEAATIFLLVLILAFAASKLVAGVIGCLVMIWGFVAVLFGRNNRGVQPVGADTVRPFLPVGVFIFALSAAAYLNMAIGGIDNAVFNDTYVVLAAQMAAIWMPALFISLALIDGPDVPLWLAFPAAIVAGLAILAAILASFFLGLAGMPLGTPDYPRAYANWQFVRSVACLILAASAAIFATAVLLQRLSRRRAAPA